MKAQSRIFKVEKNKSKSIGFFLGGGLLIFYFIKNM